MAAFRVGIIGTGNRGKAPGRTGYAMAYQHGEGYRLLGDRCEMVAVADIVQEHADAFAEHYGVPRTYLDYHEMLAREGLDIVSVCTWPHLHEQMVLDCAEAGVKAVHCEKPMALTWAGCKRMASVCAEKGVQLTFNHMRRFGRPARTAKAMLDAGEIGELVRLEFGRSNLCDYGSHQFDMTNYFNDQTPAQWVLAQIDYRTEHRVFGAHQENQAIAVWEYANGVHGLAMTGYGRDVAGAHNRLVGTEGVIELEPSGENMPVLRMRRKGGAAWEAVDCGGENVHGPGYHERGVAQVVQCLEDGTDSELGAQNALQATELIYACWESCRRRGRVDLPLDIEDNPLVAMIESGDLKPQKKE